MIIEPEILIISNQNDFASDFLVLKLIDLNVCYLRVNSEDIIKWKISYNPKQGIIFRFEDKEYILKNVNGVYFRRSPTVFNHLYENENKNYLLRECRDFYEGVYLTVNANWINPVFETYKAERKLYQLHIANKLGFRIPKSIITNNPNEIKEFIDQNDSIIKPISHGLQVNNSGVYSIYTNKIDRSVMFEKETLFEAPVFIQEKIQNKSDIRVTVVGENVFAVKIKKTNSDEVDWRRPEVEKEYEKIELPKSLAKKCKKLNNQLGLRYSAIDFIRSDNEKYTFLEINPAGEWVWLENELGLSISKSLIMELRQK